MVVAISIMGIMGVVVGVGLALASKVFYVYVDPQILAVDDALPGANCGGCGFPGCSSNAEAVVAGKSPPNSCVAAGDDVAEAIAAIMGMSIEAKEPDIAKPGCTYGVQDADIKYIYDGLSDCRAAALLSGGMKVCSIGCLGLGSCVKVCQFGALKMGSDGLPEVDGDRCTGCGACERVCPKHIISLSSVTRRIIREYTAEDCTTPCQRACPAGIDVCEYIRQISLGDYHRSVQVVKERNPFPTVIGRVCPRPCEDDCRRQLTDEPVAINFLKRFAADYERSTGKRILPYKAPDTDRRVAIIGGGVEGLSTAFFMARLGHDTTIYESTDKLGGLLRSAIAANRLPMDILDWDVEGVLEMGVKAETGKTLGPDFIVASLLQSDVEAVFLATGGWDSRLARGAGKTVENPVPGMWLLIDLLRFSKDENSGVALGSHVVIAGGGESVIDAVEKSRQMGAAKVTVLFQEDEADSELSEKQMAALREADVDVLFDAGITRLFGTNDQLTQIEYTDHQRLNKEVMAADTIVLAAGRFPQLIFTLVKPDAESESGTESESGSEEAPPEQLETELQWEAFEAYKDPAHYDQTGLLAKGDVLSDFSGAIRAIGAGRRAAATIHQTMYDIPLRLPDNVLTPKTVIQNVDTVHDVRVDPRRIMPLCDKPDCDELETGFTEDMAKAEADRCLQCGLICYQQTDESVVSISPAPPAKEAMAAPSQEG